MNPKYIVIDPKHVEMLPQYDKDRLADIRLSIDFRLKQRGLPAASRDHLVIGSDEPEFESFTSIVAERIKRDKILAERAEVIIEQESRSMSYPDRLRAYADILEKIQEAELDIQPFKCIRIRDVNSSILDHSAPGATLAHLADPEKVIEFAAFKNGAFTFAHGGTWINAESRALQYR